MMKTTLITRTLSVMVLMTLIVDFSEAKVFTEKELRLKLQQLGAPRNELDMWVCIAKYESAFNTQAIHKNNNDKSWDYGIFQINDMYWCKGQIRGKANGCGRNCNDFLKNDIRAAFKCAQTIKKLQGWDAWAVVSVQHKCSP